MKGEKMRYSKLNGKKVRVLTTGKIAFYGFESCSNMSLSYRGVLTDETYDDIELKDMREIPSDESRQKALKTLDIGYISKNQIISIGLEKPKKPKKKK
ncbi:MAG: hypothetical protein GOV02_03495 [Candidatus Aenigmarchaeota archaeon]|nr:hypothetical protein [Candidatus Aenigmarchaeota archaeon]